MGELRERMMADLVLARYSPRTVEPYLNCARDFATYFMRSPAEMGEPELREYLLHLVERQLASPSMQKMHVAALRFLYARTLRRPEVAAGIPWPKVPRTLPEILDEAEVEALLAAVDQVHHRLILMTAYGAGLRVEEACRLRVPDIDSRRMLIHVRLGKGAKDRYVPLPRVLLTGLREYWRQVRPPGPALFPGHRNNPCISAAAVEKAVQRALPKAGITKHATPHVLRASFATHLLEDGTNLRVIQVLLGHGSIRSTERYTRVSRRHIGAVTSPLDRLAGRKERSPR